MKIDKNSQSKKDPGRLRESVLTRLVLPVDFSHAFKERLNQHEGDRKNALEALLNKHFPMPNNGELNEPAIHDETLAANALYHRLVHRLLVSSKESTPECGRWELDTKILGAQSDVLLPQVIKALLTRDRQIVEDITVFKLSPENGTWPCPGELLSIKHRGSERFALLSDLRLTLCSTGVALLEIDLHLVTSKELLTSEPTPFFDELAAFTNRIHRVDEPSKGQCVTFDTDCWGLLLLSGGKIDGLRKQLFKDITKKAEKAASDNAQKPIISRAFGNLQQQVSTTLADGNSSPEWAQELVSLLRDGSTEIETTGELHRALVEQLKSAMTSPDATGDSPETDELATNILREIPSAAHDGSDSWSPSRFIDWLLQDVLQVPGFERPANNTERGRHVLSGDRFFVFTHVNTRDAPEVWLHDEVVQQQVARLARHTKPGAPDYITGQAGVYSGGGFVNSIRYASTCLEGCAVLSADKQEGNYTSKDGVRVRQFMLVRLALVYRYSLLRLSFAGDDLRHVEGEKAVAEIDLLCHALYLFGHRLYHGHISNFSHLQAFFDVLLDAFAIEKLWQDLEKDLPRILERKEMLLERDQRKIAEDQRKIAEKLREDAENEREEEQKREARREKRRARYDKLVTYLGVPGAMVLVLKEFYELSERLELGLPEPKGGWGWLSIGGLFLLGLFGWVAFNAVRERLENRDTD
jgi:hypothetical protein